MFNRCSAILVTLILGLYSTGLSAYSDFSIETAKKSIVTVEVNGLMGSKTLINAIPITANLLLVPTKSVSRVGLRLTIDEEDVAIAGKYAKEGLTLISYPKGELTPVVLANNEGEAERNLFVVNREDNVVFGTKLKSSTGELEVLSMNISTSLISHTGSAVFNNCGELIGIFDETLGSEFAQAISLSKLKTAVKDIDGLNYSSSDCPSELQKRKLELTKIQADAAAKQKAADEALQQARKEISKQETLNQQKLAKVEQDSKSELEEIKSQLTKEIDAKQAENDKALSELEAKNVETQEALSKAKETAKIAEEKQKSVIIGAIIFIILALIAAILITRRSKNTNNLDIDDQEDESIATLTFDVLIRGKEVGVKIPAELVIRPQGVILGRSATDCDFVIDSPELSRSHIKLTAKDSIIYVEDLGSANGSSINGLKMQPAQLVALHHGDELELAASMFFVEFKERQ